MLRRLLLVAFGVLAMACAGFAAGTRVVVVGVMSDSHCGLKHAVAGPDAAQCVIGCASKDADYVVASEGKLYKFEKKNPFYKNFAGKNVEAVGTLTDATFSMTDLSVVELDAGDLPKGLELFEGTLKSAAGKYTLDVYGKIYQIDTSASGDVSYLTNMVGQPADVIGKADGNVIHLHDAQSR